MNIPQLLGCICKGIIFKLNFVVQFIISPSGYYCLICLLWTWINGLRLMGLIGASVRLGNAIWCIVLRLFINSTMAESRKCHVILQNILWKIICLKMWFYSSFLLAAVFSVDTFRCHFVLYKQWCHTIIDPIIHMSGIHWSALNQWLVPLVWHLKVTFDRHFFSQLLLATAELKLNHPVLGSNYFVLRDHIISSKRILLFWKWIMSI